MATKIVLRGGGAEAVYDDRLAPLFHALGVAKIDRATDVEYDDHSRMWVATHRDTQQVIAAGPVRSEVIKQEVAWLEERM